MYGSPFVWLINTAFSLLFWVILANAILSWLIAFNVVNTRNQLIATIWDLTNRLLNPLLRPIRNLIPSLNGVDLSPLILILISEFIHRAIVEYIFKNNLL